MEEKGFFKNVFGFIFSLKFVKHLVIAVVAGMLLLFGSILWLKIFTNHGDSFSVPDFTGMKITEAVKLAKEKGLRVNISDSVWDAPGDRGTIVSQNPPKDFQVKENRRMFFTIKAFNPKMIKMPKLINESFVEAKSIMESYGLKIGKISYKPSVRSNRVLEQLYKGSQISPGDPIEYAAEVDIVLGKSDDIDNTVIPNLIGLSKSEAEEKIAEMMLNTGSVIYDESVITVEDSAACKVVRQFPNKNVEIKPGNLVDIWLSNKPDTTVIN